MLKGLVHAHSGLRWVVLGLLLYVIFNAFRTWQSGKGFSAKDLKMNTYAVAATHLQIILGFVLYFMSPRVTFAEGWMKNAASRFFGMEHVVMMLLAAILITIGSVRAKKVGAKSAFWFFLVALLVLLAGIPWPFRGLGTNWF